MKAATLSRLLFCAVFFSALPLPAAEKLSAMESLAERLTQEIEERFSPERGPVSAALSLEAEGESLERNSRLLQELEGLLQHRLADSHALSRLQVLSPGEGAAGLEKARRAGASWWFRLQLGLKKRQLVVIGDLLPLTSTFWERLAGRVPAAVAYHFLVSLPYDEEMLQLAGQHRHQPFFGAWSLTEVLRRSDRFLAVAVGNLDGEGTEEIVWLSAERLEILRWEGEEAKTLAQYSLSHLPRAAEATREPLGQVIVADVNRDGREEILFGVGSYRQGEILSWNGVALHPLRRFDGLPLCLVTRGGRLHLVLGRQTAGRFAAQLSLVDINSPGGESFSVGSPFLQLECLPRDPDLLFWRMLEPDGTLSQVDADGRRVLLKDCGRGTVLLPAIDEGSAAWLTSAAVYPGQADSLRIMRDGVQLWSSRDFVGGVVAAAVSRNPSASGWQALVLAVQDPGGVSRLYLLRR